MPRCRDLAILVRTDRQTNRLLYPLLRMRARGVIIHAHAGAFGENGPEKYCKCLNHSPKQLGGGGGGLTNCIVKIIFMPANYEKNHHETGCQVGESALYWNSLL